MRLPVIIHVVPPSQTHHETTRNVFDGPEIHREQQNNCHESGNETITEQTTKQIDENGGPSEG